MFTVRRVFAAVFLLLLSSAAYGVTYIVPPDAEMIQRSDDIVVATGVTSVVERTDQGAIVTRYTLRIEEVLKGQRTAGAHLVLTERGGQLGEHITYIPGTPKYESGARYLVFTESNRDGDPVTFGMGLGQFFFTEQNGRLLAVRGEIDGFNANLDAHVEVARDAAGFLTYIRGFAAQRVDPTPQYFVRNTNPRWQPESNGNVQALATRGSYLFFDGGKFFRWSTPTATFVKSGTAVGPNGATAVSLSFSQWNGTASNINYKDGGQDDTAVGGIENNVDTTDGKNAILFNDPNNQVGSGIAGVGGITDAGNPYTLDGENFWNMLEVDVVMNNGSFAQNCYNTVMVHEVGHTLGFKHAAESPQQADAIMNWQVMCTWNGVLKQYDKDAAATVYGSGPVCVAPSITTHPQNKTITPPGTTSLSVVAAGTSPFTYQWYIGNSGDTSSPIGGATGTTLNNLAPSVTTNYWVRVTGSCGPPADSNTATVTVTECVPVSIATQPQNKTITPPNSAPLVVEAAGTGPFTYEWFVGERGDTSNPVPNSNKPNITVSPASTTFYWVRISGACGPSVLSNTVTVTVNPCPDVTIEIPTATPSGANFILSVEASSDASGVLAYAWFRGNTPGSGGAAVGTQKTITVTVSEVTNYWVRVTNSCNNRAISDLVTVAPCTLPGIATQPADQTIASGATATLNLALAGNGVGVTVTWYRGSVPDKTNQVGVGTSVNVGPLTETTSYWAAVANTCGEVPSRTVLVTVTSDPVCIAPVITTSPISHDIKANTEANLSVIATGTAALQYQWFAGLHGDTTTPVGTNAPAFVSEKLFKTAFFWVRVTNACGSADSAAAKITVPLGRRRAVEH